MGRVLVTEQLAQPGLDLMAEAGHEVDVQLGLSPEQLVEAIVGANAVVPNHTQVPPDAMALGVPVKIREGASNRALISHSAEQYVLNARLFRAELVRIDS